MDSVTSRLTLMPGNGSSSPADLASVVRMVLRRRGTSAPPLEVLIRLFDSMYFASLKTEESRPVRFHVVYLDPEKTDPRPPKTLVHDRWSCVRLSPAIPLSSASFIKIAPASDPRTSSFAVYPDAAGR